MIQANQPKLILYFIIVAGFLGGYVYYSQGASEEISVAPLVEGREGIEKFKDFEIDFSVLDSTRLKAFKIFGDLPVKPGQTGKRDLFSN